MKMDMNMSHMMMKSQRTEILMITKSMIAHNKKVTKKLKRVITIIMNNMARVKARPQQIRMLRKRIDLLSREVMQCD
jgi:hypothetical protein